MFERVVQEEGEPMRDALVTEIEERVLVDGYPYVAMLRQLWEVYKGVVARSVT